MKGQRKERRRRVLKAMADANRRKQEAEAKRRKGEQP